MRAEDIMTTPVVSVRPDASLEEAVRIMLERRFSGLPVVDDQGRFVGLLTEGDLLRREELGTTRRRPRWLQFLTSPGRLAEEYAHARGRRVSEVMSRAVYAVAESDSLDEIVAVMAKRGIKRVPVTCGGALVGIVTRADILRALSGPLARAVRNGRRADAEIAADIQQAFEDAACVPVALIDVSVRDGVVELRGSISDERQREAVRVAVENVAGVEAIRDHLVWSAPMGDLVLLSPEDRAEEREIQRA